MQIVVSCACLVAWLRGRSVAQAATLTCITCTQQGAFRILCAVAMPTENDDTYDSLIRHYNEVHM